MENGGASSVGVDSAVMMRRHQKDWRMIMSNALLLAPADPFEPGRDGYSITVTPTTSEGTTLVGTGGCFFLSNQAASDSLYLNVDGKVQIGCGAQYFVAGFGANTKNNTAYGKVTLDHPIKADLMIGNIDEAVAVIPAGQTSGTFTVELPIGGKDLSLQEAQERFKANIAKAKAKK
jgi:hypothetical protein